MKTSFFFFAGSCKIAFNVRRARRSWSTQGENIRAHGSDKYAWSWKYDIESECIARNINQIDNGRPNQNYTYRDKLKPIQWTNLISRVHQNFARKNTTDIFFKKKHWNAPYSTRKKKWCAFVVIFSLFLTFELKKRSNENNNLSQKQKKKYVN